MDRTDGIRILCHLAYLTSLLSRRTSYVILTAAEAGYDVEFRWVDYDYDAAIEAVERCRHPGGRYIIRHLQGLATAPWEQDG